MKITLHANLDETQEFLALGVFEDDKDLYKNYNKDLAKDLEEALKKKLFSREFGEQYSTKISSLPFRRILILGLGKKEEMSLERLRRSLGKVVRQASALKLQKVATNLPILVASARQLSEEALGQATAEGLLLADYNFSKYLAKERQEKRLPLESVSVQGKSSAAFEKGLKTGRVIAEAANFVRDLVNEPANVINSVSMEHMAHTVAKKSSKITVKVLNKPELERLGMGALLGVNAGRANPPKLVFLEYNGAGANAKYTALIGKGITFDSGGYNIKPTNYIEDMKTDMAGAAAVMGTIKVAAQLGVKKNLVGVMALCENMVSATAQRPGDIVKAYNGKTIEIGNTDAEGRLVLADALAYTEDKYKPEVMIDLATLTGACIVALGYYTAGAIGNDENLLASLKEAGMQSGDRVWPLPFFDEYQDWMDGTITDLNNNCLKAKGREAGAITAAVFLGKFVAKAKWVHLDIAGSAYWTIDNDYLQKGATGSGVRVLSYWLLGEK